LIWGMMNIVNFAHGDFVMLGMYVAFVVWTLLGVGPFVGAPIACRRLPGRLRLLPRELPAR
jgi:branched-chain amino acid transport system permease protein